MAIRGSETIPSKYSNPSHPANHPNPEDRKSLDERLLDRKASDRIHMDASTFVAHHGHRKGEDPRLRPYTGSG